MRRRGTLIEGYIKPRAVFYGFILGYCIGIKWNLAPNGGMGNPRLLELTRAYLTYVCGDDEWSKRQVLDVIRDKTRNQMRDVAVDEFPSLFPKGRQRPLQIPDELKGQEVKFDLDFIQKMKDSVESIKQEIAMSEETTNEVAGAPSTTPRRTTTIVVPEGVDVNSLTLDNFQQITGKRFRMTKEQSVRAEAGTLTRAQALEEFKKELASKPGDSRE